MDERARASAYSRVRVTCRYVCVEECTYLHTPVRLFIYEAHRRPPSSIATFNQCNQCTLQRVKAFHEHTACTQSPSSSLFYCSKQIFALTSPYNIPLFLCYFLSRESLSTHQISHSSANNKSAIMRFFSTVPALGYHKKDSHFTTRKTEVIPWGAPVYNLAACARLVRATVFLCCTRVAHAGLTRRTNAFSGASFGAR